MLCEPTVTHKIAHAQIETLGSTLTSTFGRCRDGSGEPFMPNAMCTFSTSDNQPSLKGRVLSFDTLFIDVVGVFPEKTNLVYKVL